MRTFAKGDRVKLCHGDLILLNVVNPGPKSRDEDEIFVVNRLKKIECTQFPACKKGRHSAKCRIGQAGHSQLISLRTEFEYEQGLYGQPKFVRTSRPGHVLRDYRRRPQWWSGFWFRKA